MVEAQRPDPEDLHDEGPGRLRGPEDEALRHGDPDVLDLARHRIGVRREGHVEVPGNTEGAAAAGDRHLDGREHGLLDGRHGAGEQLERSVAPGLAREDADQGLARLGRRALGDVEPERPAALVDRLRPGGGVDHVKAVEPELAEAPFLDVVRHQRLAETARRVAAEVARTREVAVAALDVVDLELPAGDLVTGRGLPLRLRHRASSTRATNTHPRARSSTPAPT